MSKDYRDTLNLPQTDLSMKAGLAKKEPELLSYWNSIDLYSKIREQNNGKEQFILHDGPPYANGDIHLGHAVNKVLKDITIKYQSLLGKDAPYVPGWDCHGLPIELNIEKKHGKNSDLVQDKEAFQNACKEYAESQVVKQMEDFKNPLEFNTSKCKIIIHTEMCFHNLIVNEKMLNGMGYCPKLDAYYIQRDLNHVLNII